MDDLIDVVTADGREFKADVIDVFGVKEYPDKDYLLYSLGEELPGDNTKIYVSIIGDISDGCKLYDISDPTEWSIVQGAIAGAINNGVESNG